MVRRVCFKALVVLLLCAVIAVIVVVITVPNIANSTDSSDSAPVVNTNYGLVRGYKAVTMYAQRPYYAFKGIPYARPPIEALRFKPPQRPFGWSGTRDAFYFGNVCVQLGAQGQEDCLFLNVYTPNVTPYTKLPVLVSIHGGAFAVGSGDSIGPDFLLNEANIVLVTFNYRVGPLGFLSLGTPEYSGNMGLKDQLMAIKWVIDNIANFGGDKYAITLHGISAGSASVHMHMISPGSKGTFQRAIMSSGVALNPWTYTYTDHLPILTKFAQSYENIATEGDAFVSFLKTVDAEQLTIQTAVTDFVSNSGRKELDFIWVPVVEPAGTVDPFFDRSPSEILSDNFQTTIDAMFCFQSDESYAFIDKDLRDPTRLSAFNATFEIELPLVKLNNGIDYASTKYRQMADKIRQHYFGKRPVDATTLLEYNQLVTDVAFAYGIDTAVKLQAAASTGKTFYYRFSVSGMYNFVKLQTLAFELGLPGATHGDDMFYLFGSSALKPAYDIAANNSLEREMVTKMSQLYTNFIIYGKPMTDVLRGDYLEPVRLTTMNYLDITNEGMVLGTNPNADRMDFWTNCIAEYENN